MDAVKKQKVFICQKVVPPKKFFKEEKLARHGGTCLESQHSGREVGGS